MISIYGFLGLFGLLAGIGCSLQPKEMGNVYRGVLPDNIKGFDPAQVSDLYSYICQKQIFEGLYQYQYLSRPYDVEPCLAESLPRVSSDGLAYTLTLKKGVCFTDDPCFPNGKGREITASDFIYSVKRIADVRTKSTGWWLFDGKITGLDEFRDSSRSWKTDTKADYLAPLEGLVAPDRYLVIITLKKPCPYFKYILSMTYAVFICREAVEYYGEEFLNHPVGTGPYVLKEWRRGQRLVFERNPKYRHGFYPAAGEAEDRRGGLLADSGRPLPFIDRLEYYVFLEDQPMLLNFLRGHLDVSGIPKDNYNQIITAGKKLRDKFDGQGIVFDRSGSLDLTYITFNFTDPVLGKQKKLRQAMSLAVNRSRIIELFYNGRAIPAQSPLPPGLFGYEAAYQGPYQAYDTVRAQQLLAEAGFPLGKGVPEFEYLVPGSTTSRQMGELFVSEMAVLGIRIKINSVTWPEFLRCLKEKKFQIAGSAWNGDYPDPENFFMLLYGPNEAPGENAANYHNPEYDSLYRIISVRPDGLDRLNAIKRMKDIVAEDCPWILETHRVIEGLRYRWLKNFKYSSVSPGDLKYYKIDMDIKHKYLTE
jgi:ABC-type transport system substrate-binding protein